MSKGVIVEAGAAVGNIRGVRACGAAQPAADVDVLSDARIAGKIGDITGVDVTDIEDITSDGADPYARRKG